MVVLEFDVGVSVVGDEVEFGGFAEAVAVLVDDGEEADSGAIVADGDGGGKVMWGVVMVGGG